MILFKINEHCFLLKITEIISERTLFCAVIGRSSFVKINVT